MSSEDAALDRAIAALELLRQQADTLPALSPSALAADPVFLDKLLADVQSQRHTQVQLQRLKEWSDLAQEAGGVGAYEYNAKTHELSWSASVRAVYEMDDVSSPSLEQWLGTIHPDDRD